jgi:hypothetical protein
VNDKKPFTVFLFYRRRHFDFGGRRTWLGLADLGWLPNDGMKMTDTLTFADGIHAAAQYVQGQHSKMHGTAPSALAEQILNIAAPEPPRAQVLRLKENKIAIAFSSKNRFELSMQTLPMLLAEDGIDVFWIDGSDPTPKRDEFLAAGERHTALKEIHTGVGGGPDMAIQYGLQLLFARGYDFIGLLENDVQLQTGWLERVMALFETPGMLVGAVSARCYQNRILKPMDGFAVMANVGAGNIIFRRDMVPIVLCEYRRPMLWELRMVFKSTTGIDYPIPSLFKKTDPEMKNFWVYDLSPDWWFEGVLRGHGWNTLAPTPSLATDLDCSGGDEHQLEPTMERKEA